MADPELGPLLRLWGLSARQLPPPGAAAIDDLAPLLLALLQEAVAFVDTADDPAGAPGATWRRRGSKAFSGKATGGSTTEKNNTGTTTHVDIIERVVPSAVLETVAARRDAAAGNSSEVPPSTQRRAAGATTPPERWIGRRSRHRDAAVPGTASWAEFRTYLQERHAETEEAMTPTVVGGGSTGGTVWSIPATWHAEEGGRRWGGFALALHAMRHRVGRPLLKDRVFPVLQMSCAAVGDGGSEPPIPEILIASVTVDDWLADGPAHGDGDGTTTTSVTPPDVVVAAYVSVERIRALPAGDDDGDRQIEWLMATASDARGVLPAWVQAQAVPAAIAKDVPLFLRWMADERRRVAVAAFADSTTAAAAASTAATDAPPAASNGTTPA